MKLLKQNHHGLPGIGVSGQTGQTGENGKSIYFGFINDFFDGDKIETATYIYAAKRALQEDISSGGYTDKSALLELIQKEIGLYDDNSTFMSYTERVNRNASIDKMPYLDVNILYYTANKLVNKEMLPDKLKSDITDSFIDVTKELKLDVNGEFLQMSFMVATAINSSADKVIDGFKSYKLEENITPNEVLSDSLNVQDKIIYQNINNDITHYTFNDNAALILDQTKEYTLNGSINYANTITFDTIDAIYNNSINAAEDYAKGDFLDNQNYSTYYQYPFNSSISYVSEDISANEGHLYALDANSYKATFNINSDSSTYAVGLYSENYYFGNNDVSSWNEVYKMSAITNKENISYKKVYQEGDLQDDNKNSFYGVPPRALFINTGSGVEINRTDNSSFLNAFPKYYNNSSQEYMNHVHTLVNLPNGTNVYYTLNQDDTYIFIPMSLRSDIKVGDVIYFYTDQDVFNNDYTVNYMVVVTENLLNCTPKALIEAATISDPLNVKFFSENQNRICNFHNIAVLKNDVSLLESDVKLKSLSNKSYISIVDEYTTSAALLSSKRGFLTSIAYHKLQNNNSNINYLSNKIKDNEFVMQANKPLKMRSLCVNQRNISSLTNVELSKLIYNSNVILYDNYFVKPLVDIDLYNDNNNEYASIFVANINGNEYFTNIENLDNYFYGCDIYNKDMEKLNTLTSSEEILNVEIIPTIDNDVYYIQMFASCGSGLKYHSKLTKLTIEYDTFNFINDIKNMRIPAKNINKNSSKRLVDSEISKYSKDIQGIEIKKQIKSFSLEIIGDDQNIIKQKYSGNIIFDISDITAEEIDNASLKIYSDNDNIEILDIMFNNTLYTTSLNINNWSHIQKIQNSSFEYIIDMSTNLPLFDSSSYNTLNEYVFSGADRLDDSPESPLFKKLVNNTMEKPTKSRSILVTAKYKFVDSDDIYYENFNLIQPGFTDTRNAPDIKLNIHANIKDLETFNKLENGVLANQFVTYLDIDITKFKDCWGKFANTSTNISMNIELRNLQYDFDWQNKYVIKDLYGRRTFRAINEQSDVSILNNYIKTSISIDKTTFDETSTVDVSVYSYLMSINDEKHINVTSIDDYDYEQDSDNNKYILFDASSGINNIIKNSNKIYNGLQNNIVINLKNIDVNHDSDKIRLKLLTEIGNPIISNIYYKFYVKAIHIYVSNPSKSESKDFYTLFPESIDETAGQTYLCEFDKDDTANIVNVNYKFISDSLDVTFNPLSYTICPSDIENTYTNIYGNDIYKYGVQEQIIKKLQFFNNSVYNDSLYNIKDKLEIRDGILYDYANLNIKKSYIQDNIKNINVKPISLYDIINIIDTSMYKSLNIDSSLKTHYILDFIEGNKYLSMAYHSVIMQPKIRNNQYTFFYNDKEYPRIKYDQKLNNLPVFAYDEQSIELRDDKLINSMDKWNDWYVENYQTNDKTYQGVLSLYGNGYTQIQESDVENIIFTTNKTNTITIESSGSNKKVTINKETSGEYNAVISKTTQAKDDSILSIDKVKSLNDEYINTYSETNEINVNPMKQDQPNKGEYFRGFLYDINWEFPYYDNHNIIPYRIVTPFDNLLNNIAVNGEIQGDASIYQSYYDELIEKNKSEKLYGTRMIPYTLLYNIYPRVAYNYDNNKINVFMLRRPSVGVDTDIIDGSTFNEKYEFNRRLFNLTNFEKLKSPYTVEE